MTTRRHFGLFTAGAVGQLAAASKEMLVYVGTYTRGGSKGIYVYRFDPARGKLTDTGVVAELENPSFLCTRGNRLYAVGESKTGMVAAFDIDRASGKLKKLNEKASGGEAPCHLTSDKNGKNLIVVHYDSGNVSVFQLKPDGALGERTALVQDTGTFGPDKRRQDKAHAHSVNLSKNEKYAVVGDLGLDQFIVYALDGAKGTLTPHSAGKVKPGAGPRHFSFHPSYRLAYGVNEMGSSVNAYRWDEATGTLTDLQTITTLPTDFQGTSSCAEILVHPSGKYVYASNRGHDSIAGYSVAGDGKLTSLGNTSTQGKTPRNFRIDPSGKWLIAANQDTGTLVVFRIDEASGKLSPNGEQAKVPFPVCLKFV